MNPDETQAASHRQALQKPSFTINGRFLTQPTTGVQRYAREITSAMDAVLLEHGRSADLVTPGGAVAPPGLRAITTERLGSAAGQAWEQIALPLRRRGPLLNLCNTAPIFGGRNVVCIHDANVFTAPGSYSKAFRTFYKILQPQIVRRAVSLTTVSHHAAAQIAKHLNVELRRIVVLPNGHEHTLRWNPSQSRFAAGEERDRPYVLLIGSLARHKNIGRVAGLASALESLGLDIRIVGASAAVFAGAGQTAAPNVHWLGKVSDDDLGYLLKNALCLAFPSISEGFGIPALEAMAVGCPVVASNSSSLPEVCGHAALLADPGDDGQWLEHFTALARSPALYQELREKGLVQAKCFSWTASAEGYFDLMNAA